jgi:hypothetical protein
MEAAIAINWMAIIACMIAAVVIGFMWYGPLFGKPWMKEMKMSMPDKAPNMTQPIVLSLIGAFFMAYALNHGLVFGNAYLNMSGVVAGMQGAFWYWLGFIVPPMLSFVAWEGKSWKLFFIQAGYWLALLLVMAAILMGWQ